MLKRSLTLMLVVLVGLIGALAGHTPAGAAGTVYSPPGKYYLALGDSLAFGYQQAKVAALVKATGTADPNAFNTGYVDDFSRMLQAIDPGIQTVNLGCPGATSGEVASSAGCTTYPYPLHVSYTTSQLQAAVNFIQAH